ncbi:hypothetical protein BU23DRAFT_464551, partial [Bimuria novae-zelandiae CBS 107.79]
GLISITKRDFFRMFYRAWHTAFKYKTIITLCKTPSRPTWGEFLSGCTLFR